MHTDTQIVTLFFTIVTGVGVLLQALVLFGMFLALRETQKKVHALTDRLEEHVLPSAASVRTLIEDLSPKVKLIAGNLVDASSTLRTQAENVGSVVKDATDRTKHQTARLDAIVSGAMNGVGQATSALERGIAAPIRQVNGILNGLRAGIETLKAPSPHTAKAARHDVRAMEPDQDAVDMAAQSYARDEHVAAETSVSS